MAIIDVAKCDNKGLILVLCGPSGVGKTSIKISLLSQNKDFELVPSVTTRPKTKGDDATGIKEYHHITEAEYGQLYEHGMLISKKVEQFGFHYGIIISEITCALDGGCNVLLETTLWGIEQLKRYFNNIVSVFVSPPSIEELERRLRKRSREDEGDIVLRLGLAKQVLAGFRKDMVDYHLINKDLQMSIDFVNRIIVQKNFGCR